MHTTRLSLLLRLDLSDPIAWKEFDSLYRPMLLRWLRNYTPKVADAEDLVQEIMLFIAQNISSFEHNRRIGAFRKWLRTCAVNIGRNYLRKHHYQGQVEWVSLSALLDQWEQPDTAASEALEQACRETLISHLMEKIAPCFEAKTMEIFRQFALEERPLKEVMERCQVSQAAVYTTKSRVMRRLREEAAHWPVEDLPW